MKKALSITATVSTALVFSSNSVWAASESVIASPPGPEALLLFGAVILGMLSVNRIRLRR